MQSPSFCHTGLNFIDVYDQSSRHVQRFNTAVLAQKEGLLCIKLDNDVMRPYISVYEPILMLIAHDVDYNLTQGSMKEIEASSNQWENVQASLDEETFLDAGHVENLVNNSLKQVRWLQEKYPGSKPNREYKQDIP